MKGFTLIEVLVVSLLVAIMAGAIFFSFDVGERNQVRNKAMHFRHVLRNLGNEAVLSGRMCGVKWDNVSATPQCRTAQGEVENMESAFGKVVWGDRMSLVLFGEDGAVLQPKTAEEKEAGGDEEKRPDKFYDIQIWPTGLWEPAGSILFKSASDKVAYSQLSWSSNGRMQLDRITPETLDLDGAGP